MKVVVLPSSEEVAVRSSGDDGSDSASEGGEDEGRDEPTPHAFSEGGSTCCERATEEVGARGDDGLAGRDEKDGAGRPVGEARRRTEGREGEKRER